MKSFRRGMKMHAAALSKVAAMANVQKANLRRAARRKAIKRLAKLITVPTFHERRISESRLKRPLANEHAPTTSSITLISRSTRPQLKTIRPPDHSSSTVARIAMIAMMASNPHARTRLKYVAAILRPDPLLV